MRATMRTFLVRTHPKMRIVERSMYTYIQFAIGCSATITGTSTRLAPEKEERDEGKEVPGDEQRIG